MQRGTPNDNDERIARQEELMKKFSNRLMSARVEETDSESSLPLASAKGTSKKEELEPSCTDTVGVHELSMKRIEELEAALKKSYEKNRIERNRARKLLAQMRKDRRARKSNGYLVEEDSDDEDSNNAALLQYYEEQIQLLDEEMDVLRQKEGTWKGYEKERAEYRQLAYNHVRSSLLEIGESIEDEVLQENYLVNVRFALDLFAKEKGMLVTGGY